MNFLLFRYLLKYHYMNHLDFSDMPKDVVESYFKEKESYSNQKIKHNNFLVVDSIDYGFSRRLIKGQVEFVKFALNETTYKCDGVALYHFAKISPLDQKKIIKDFIFDHLEFFDRINEFFHLSKKIINISEQLDQEPLYVLLQEYLPLVDIDVILNECDLTQSEEYHPSVNVNDILNEDMCKFLINQTHKKSKYTNVLIEYKPKQSEIVQILNYILGKVYTNNEKEDIIVTNANAPMNLSKEREEPYMFTIGNDTINKMNCIKVEIQTTDLDQMSRVIGTLKSSIDRYKKFSNIGFFKKMFSSKLEIQANITISVINFESALDNGYSVRERLQKQYESFETSSIQLKNIFDDFSKNLEELNTYIESTDIDHHAKERLLRRKNDLMAAQILCSNSAAQFELSMANVITLIDKFTTIEQILKPVITQNMQLTKEMNRSLK